MQVTAPTGSFSSINVVQVSTLDVYAFDPVRKRRVGRMQRCAGQSGKGLSLSFTGSNQAYRAISTGQLNALLRLHLRPIDVVVYHGPQGYLVLRGASRLDAFSGYPVRT